MGLLVPGQVRKGCCFRSGLSPGVLYTEAAPRPRRSRPGLPHSLQAGRRESRGWVLGRRIAEIESRSPNGAASRFRPVERVPATIRRERSRWAFSPSSGHEPVRDDLAAVGRRHQRSEWGPLVEVQTSSDYPIPAAHTAPAAKVDVRERGAEPPSSVGACAVRPIQLAVGAPSDAGQPGGATRSRAGPSCGSLGFLPTPSRLGTWPSR